MKDYRIPVDILTAKELGVKRVIFYIAHEYTNLPIDDKVQLCGYSLRRSLDDISHQFKTFVTEMNGFQWSGSKQYSIIKQSEFEQIVKDPSSNQAVCLLILAYIRMYMRKDPSQPRFYSWFQCNMREQIGIGRYAFKNGIDTLSRLDILYYERKKSYQDESGNWHRNVTVFVNARGEEWEKDYNWAVELSKSNRYIDSAMVD